MKNVVIALGLVVLVSACGGRSGGGLGGGLGGGVDLATNTDLSAKRNGPQSQDPYGRGTALAPK